MVGDSPEAYAEALADLADRVNPMSIIIAGTPRGNEVASHTAGILNTVFSADRTDLSETGIEGKHPYIISIRPGIFKPKEPENGRTGTVISRPFTPSSLQK